MKHLSAFGWLLIVLTCFCGVAAADTPGWDPGPAINGMLCFTTPRNTDCFGFTVYTNEQVTIKSLGYDYDNFGDPTANDGTHCTVTYRKAGDTQEILMGKIKGDATQESLCPCSEYASNPLVYSWRMPGHYIVKAVWDDHHVYADDPPQTLEYDIYVVHNPNDSIHYAYDVNGRLATMQDQRGTTVYANDRLMRLQMVTEPDTKYIEYSYNWQDQRTSMRDHFAGNTAYTYDGYGRLYQLTDRSNGVATYTYYPNGALHQMDYPNGAYAHYTYNERDWLTDLTHRKSNNDLIAQFTYAYDPTYWGKNGTRTGVTEQVLTPSNSYIQAAVAYTYDDAYRLTGEIRTGDYAYGKTYTYDAVGNRLTKVENAATTYYHYDYEYPAGLSANKLMDFGTSNVPGSTSNTLLAYDSAGNLTTETPPNSDPVTGYEWDWANMLRRITTGGTTTAVFGYNGFGFRSSVQVGTSSDTFLYDRGVLSQEVDSTGNCRASYVTSAGITSRLTTSDASYLHGDGGASVRAITDDQSPVTVTDAYMHDSWGSASVHVGATEQPSQYVGQMGYYTHGAASGIDVLQLGIRYYDASTGRFISRDPIRDEANLYGYVSGNPVMLVDPRGTSSIMVGLWPNIQPLLKPLKPVGAGAVAGCVVGGLGGSVFWSYYTSHHTLPPTSEGEAYSACLLKCWAGLGCVAGGVAGAVTGATDNLIVGVVGLGLAAGGFAIMQHECEDACAMQHPGGVPCPQSPPRIGPQPGGGVGL